MSFWDLSDGESAKDTGKSYEVPAGGMEPIPNNSDCLAEIMDAKWREKDGLDGKVRFVEIKWQVEKPEQFENRIVFQKLWVDDLDPSAKSEEKATEKRDKARRMLASIDANAKGRLMKSTDAPTDDSLALALVGARCVIKVMLWEMKDSRDPGSTMRGNWVAAVDEKTKQVKIGDPLPPAKSSGSGAGGRPSSGGAGAFDLDDEIPFAPERLA